MKKYRKLLTNEVCETIDWSRSVMILSHTNPDGDTVGSACALSLILKNAGKSVVYCCSDPIPERLAFIESIAGIKTFQYIPGSEDDHDLIISVDVAAPNQLGTLEPIADKVDIMIDHHASGSPFADNYIDPCASACAELIFLLFEHYRPLITQKDQSDISRCIFAAISSDTGSFKFSNTTEKTFSIAASLLMSIKKEPDGLDIASISRLLHDSRTLTELKAEKLSLENIVTGYDGKIAAVLITYKMLLDNGLSYEDVSSIVDIPRSINTVLIALSIKQEKDDPTSYKISSRANTDIDVASVCSSFGGGGHKRAAGCSIHAASPDEALKIALDSFGKLIRDE